MKAYLGLGSNVGDKAGYLKKAIAKIQELDRTTLTRTAAFYETEPWGKQDQDVFINSAVEIQTELTAEELFKEIKRRVFFYRNIFIFFGIVFLCLTEILLFHTPNWNFKLLFGHGASFKALLSSISGSFSLAALWIGCSLRAGIEAIHENTRKAKRKLKRLYLASDLTPIERQKYQLVKEEIHQCSRKAVFEYDRIEKQELNAQTKNTLILQIIEKQKENLIRCIGDFQS